MKIMIFVEGTVLMHQGAIGVSREEAVRLSHQAGIQKEEIFRKLDDESDYIAPAGSVHDYSAYVPTNGVLDKIKSWKKQNTTIYYLSSRRTKRELGEISDVLKKFDFPDRQNLVFRKQGENYKNVAERIMPNILIEDDCESIGGEIEMTYPHIDPEKKKLIKSVVVKEFGGIDSLPGNLDELVKV